MTWLVERPIAHRGLHRGTDVPENSLLAFEMAIREGYPVELDIQFLADETPVVFHDNTLGRMTGRDEMVCRQTCAEIRSLRLCGTDQPIPLFDEVLQFVGGRVPLLIEVNNEAAVGRREAGVWGLLQAYAGEFAIHSLNPATLEWFLINAPHVCRGQLCSSQGADILSLDIRSDPDFIAYDHHHLPNRWVEEERVKRNIPVIAWTIRTPEAYARVRPYAENVIFEGFRISEP